jgi:hypothetical protein
LDNKKIIKKEPKMGDAELAVFLLTDRARRPYKPKLADWPFQNDSLSMQNLARLPVAKKNTA